MNWYKSESATYPLDVDTTSSKKYNYIRKNITEVVKEEITYYEFEECKILKEDWFLYESIIKNESDVSDLAEAIDILTTIILEG